MCGNDLQGPKGGPAVVLLPHIVVIAALPGAAAVAAGKAVAGED